MYNWYVHYNVVLDWVLFDSPLFQFDFILVLFVGGILEDPADGCLFGGCPIWQRWQRWLEVRKIEGTVRSFGYHGIDELHDLLDERFFAFAETEFLRAVVVEGQKVIVYGVQLRIGNIDRLIASNAANDVRYCAGEFLKIRDVVGAQLFDGDGRLVPG